MKHTVYFKAAQNMNLLGDNTIDIVVTSPPYPMIEMWDEIMSSQNYEIKKAFEENKPRQAFELMHQELDKVWTECWRVLNSCVSISGMLQELSLVSLHYIIIIPELFRLVRS